MKKIFALFAFAGLLTTLSCGNESTGTREEKDASAADSAGKDSSEQIQVGSNSSDNLNLEKEKKNR